MHVRTICYPHTLADASAGVRGQIKKDQLHIILSVVGTPTAEDIAKARTDKVRC